MYGTVLDNQKCVSVQMTFLTESTLHDVYREGYTENVRMEAGRIYQRYMKMFRPKGIP